MTKPMEYRNTRDLETMKAANNATQGVIDFFNFLKNSFQKENGQALEELVRKLDDGQLELTASITFGTESLRRFVFSVREGDDMEIIFDMTPLPKESGLSPIDTVH